MMDDKAKKRHMRKNAKRRPRQAGDRGEEGHDEDGAHWDTARAEKPEAAIEARL